MRPPEIPSSEHTGLRERDLVDYLIDGLAVLAFGVLIAVVGAVVGALYIVWVADTFLVGP